MMFLRSIAYAVAATLALAGGLLMLAPGAPHSALLAAGIALQTIGFALIGAASIYLPGKRE